MSTSKVQFALWTLALSYALLVIAFHDAADLSGTLDPRYLLLLGFPAGAAIGAKAITVGQIAGGAISKNPPEFKKKTPAMAVKDIVSDDHGDLDLGDTQYSIFTLVALTIFFIAFFRHPTKLPVLPDTLVGLTSVSAAAYVAKKAVSRAPVKIAAVSPQRGPAGTIVKIFGSGLYDPTSGNGGPPDVTFGGLAADIVQASWTGTLVYATLPPNLPQGTADVQVITPDGRSATLPNAFEVSDASWPAPGSRPMISSHVAASLTVRTGRPSWLVTVAAEADRLEAELDVAVSVSQRSVPPGSASPADGLTGLPEEPNTQALAQAETAIRSAITQTRQIVASYRGLSIRGWWFGTSIESAWQALHLASENLVVVQSDADLRAQVPRLESMARAAFDSQRSSAERQELGTWLSPPATNPDRRVARRIMNAYHIVSDARRQQIRGLRNLLYLIAAVLVALDCALWATGLTTGSVVGLGAMGGALSAVFVILGGRPDGPYNPLPAQVLLKVAAGATTAVLAVEILDFVTGPSVAALPASSARDNVCAILFGFSQQAFTYLADRQVSLLSAAARAGSVESEAAPVAAQHPEQGIRRLALTRAGVITAELAQVVGNVVEQRLSGPPVDDFDGYVGVSITDLTRDALLAQDGRVFAAAPGSSCRLRMWIATGKEQGQLVEPISLRGGNKPAVVEFGALPNLHGVVMTPLDARLRLNTRRGLDRAEFAFTAPEQPRRYSCFIEVSQRTKSVLLFSFELDITAG